MATIYLTGWEMGSKDLGLMAETNLSVITTQSPGSWSVYQLFCSTATAQCQFPIASSSELYLGFRFNCGGAYNSTRILLFHTADGTVQARLGMDAASGQLKAWRGDGTTLLATGSRVWTVSTWNYIEVHFKPHDTTGVFDVKVDGVSDLTFSGDTKAHASETNINSLSLRGNGYFDDLIVNDATGAVNNTWPTDTMVQGLFPTAAGDVTQLTRGGADSGANWSQVDEKPPNDATDYVFSATVDQYDLYNLGNLSADFDTVSACCAWARALKSDAGAGSLRIPVKSGGTESDDSDQALSTSWVYYKRVMDRNPIGPANWTPAAVDALQAGVKVR